MKIRLTCNWCSDKDLVKRFTRVYIAESNADSNFVFTASEDYDFLVVINYPRYPINFPKEKTLGVIMEPSWSKHFELRYLLEPISNHILYHKKLESSQYIYYPGLLPYHFDYHDGDNLDYYVNNNFNKSKHCSIVVSYNTTTPHKDNLYKARTNFALELLKTDLDIDVYGNSWEQSGIIDSRIKGTINNKKDALQDYKFSIAIENCIEKDYFTEKLTDCILTNTVPIYFGCPNIERFFKNTPVIQLNDLSYKGIKQVEEVLLNKAPNIDQLNFEKQLMADKFNLYTAIKKYIKSINTAL